MYQGGRAVDPARTVGLAPFETGEVARQNPFFPLPKPRDWSRPTRKFPFLNSLRTSKETRRLGKFAGEATRGPRNSGVWWSQPAFFDQRLTSRAGPAFKTLKRFNVETLKRGEGPPSRRALLPPGSLAKLV